LPHGIPPKLGDAAHESSFATLLSITTNRSQLVYNIAKAKVTKKRPQPSSINLSSPQYSETIRTVVGADSNLTSTANLFIQASDPGIKSLETGISWHNDEHGQRIPARQPGLTDTQLFRFATKNGELRVEAVFYNRHKQKCSEWRAQPTSKTVNGNGPKHWLLVRTVPNDLYYRLSGLDHAQKRRTMARAAFGID